MTTTSTFAQTEALHKKLMQIINDSGKKSFILTIRNEDNQILLNEM